MTKNKADRFHLGPFLVIVFVATAVASHLVKNNWFVQSLITAVIAIFFYLLYQNFASKKDKEDKRED